MCKAKADGGERCSFHLKQGVTTGVTAFAAATSGLTGKNATAVFEDLKREGQNLPDPDQEEVDGFLARTEFNVRQDSTLAEPKRESIAARIRAAIGKILPDGATFHAWKNVVAESWKRARRYAVVGFLSAGLTFGLAACGNTPPDHVQAPPSQPAASAPAVVTPSAPSSAVIGSQTPAVAKPSVSPDAISKFGQAKVDAGYQQATALTNTSTFQRDLLETHPYTAKDFAAGRDQMTPNARKKWDDAVAKMLKGDADGKSKVMTMSYYGITGGDFKLAPTGPVAVNQTITKSKITVDSEGRMQVSFTHHGEVRALQGDKAVRYPVDKTVTYWLAPAKSSSTGWQIDAWSANYQSGNLINE